MRYCDVHKVYFEFNEHGWPDCEERIKSDYKSF